MIRVQLISKPVAPPWNDATKVLVRGLLSGGTACDYRFFGTPASRQLERQNVVCDVIASVDRFQPSLTDHARTLARIVRTAPRVDVYHCLFTPNRRTSPVINTLLKALRRPALHTLCSSPSDWQAIVPLLTADRIVTVSAWAARCLAEHGVRNAVHIRPGIPDPVADPAAIAEVRKAHDLPEERPCLLFAGDYEFSGAHPVILAALPAIVRELPDAIVVFACRTKTPEAVAIETQVRQHVDAAGLSSHVRFLRQVTNFEARLAASSLMLFPVQSLHKKMDIPLTLLQALALKRPVVVSTLEPLLELLEEPVGVAVPPGDADALAAAVIALLRNPGERAAMGNAGRDLVLERYSVSQMVVAYERLYASFHMDGRR